MTTLPPCPKCNSEYSYQDGAQLVCPECGHEWVPGEIEAGDEAKVIKDAVGNVLADGDTVTVIKDLKVKGSSLVVKVGTKVQHPPGRWRPRHRLQDRRHRPDGPEVGVREEGLSRSRGIDLGQAQPHSPPARVVRIG